MENNKGDLSSVDIGEVVPIPDAAPSASNPGAIGNTTGAEEGVFSNVQPKITLAELGTLFSSSSMAADAFNWHTALSLIVASKLVYSDKEDVENTAKDKWGLDSCKFIEVDNSQCFIAASADNVLISFRGTEELADWIDNITFLPTTRSYGEVHSGFYNNYNALSARLEEELDRLEPSNVLLTGHSLGGALATVAAAEWSEAYPISGVYTYGQPAVGRGDFRTLIKTRYSDKFFRFVNDDDVVSRVPPNYRHVGKLFHFNKQGALKSGLESNGLESNSLESIGSDSESSESEMMTEVEFEAFREELASQDASGPLEGVALEGILPSVSDHSIDVYIRKIKALTS